MRLCCCATSNSNPTASIISRRSSAVSTSAIFPAIALLASATSARATTRTVDNLGDNGSAGSLRKTITISASGDVIIFSVTGTITLTMGELALN